MIGQIGPEKYIDREVSLNDFTDSYWGGGGGMFCLSSPSDIPDELVDYCRQMFQVMQLPVPPKDVILLGAWATMWAIDLMDPYSLLCGVSSVEVSDDWSEFAYEFLETKEEMNPERLETYISKPGQDEVMYQEMLKNHAKGLSGLPYNVGGLIAEALYEYEISSPDALTEEDNAWLKKHTHIADTSAFTEFAAWASFLWIAGPGGRMFRHAVHPIFNIAEEYGEAVMYDCEILSPDCYTKLPRLPQSCVICGLKGWCVEMVHIEGVSRYMCEYHVNGQAKVPNSNCGTKHCKYPECPHHSHYGQRDAMHSILSGSGQLAIMTKRGSLHLGSRIPLLSN